MRALPPEAVRFRDAKVGDKVVRVLGLVIPICTIVTAITVDKIIVNGDIEFDRETGNELVPFHGFPHSKLL